MHLDAMDDIELYDNPEKDLYRKRLHATADRLCRAPRKWRTVVYLDTGVGLETRHLLGLGYSPDGLFPVNKSAAKVAHLTMGLKADSLPVVNGCGIDFERALQERLAGRRPDIVNFDGTHNLGPRVVAMVQASARSMDRGVLGVTMLGGRESNQVGLAMGVGRALLDLDRLRLPHTTSFGRRVNQSHALRLRNLIGSAFMREEPCRHHVRDIVWDVYLSPSRQPMVWAVFVVVPHQDDSSVVAEFKAANTSRSGPRLTKKAASMAKLALHWNIWPACCRSTFSQAVFGPQHLAAAEPMP